jgi:hypothetical protein
MCGACACWAVYTGLQISGPNAVRCCAIASPHGAWIKLEKLNEHGSPRRATTANCRSPPFAAASRIRNNRCDLKFAADHARTRNQREPRSITIPLWHMGKGNRRSRDFSGAPKWKQFRQGGPFWNSVGAGVHPPPVLALGVRCRCKSAPRRPRTPKATTVGAAASRWEPPNSFRGGAHERSDKAPPITMRFSAGHEQRRLRREQEPGAPANFQSARPSRNPANPLEPFL